MSKEIARKLKQLRKDKGLTQEQLADKINITRSSISSYEVGRRIPHLRDLLKFADFFKVGIDYFGINAPDEALNLLARAKTVFESSDVDAATKEELYREFMKLYLKMKEGQN